MNTNIAGTTMFSLENSWLPNCMAHIFCCIDQAPFSYVTEPLVHLSPWIPNTVIFLMLRMFLYMFVELYSCFFLDLNSYNFSKVLSEPREQTVCSSIHICDYKQTKFNILSKYSVIPEHYLINSTVNGNTCLTYYANWNIPAKNVYLCLREKYAIQSTFTN